MNLYSLQSILNLTPAFVISCCVQVEQGNAGMGEDGRCTNSGSSPYLFVVHVLNMLLNLETVPGRQVPIFSYFFLFFSAYSYFSYFLAISSYFSYFLVILLFQTAN